MNEDLISYVREHSQPTALDVEVAKRVFFEQVDDATEPSTGLIVPSGILSRIERALFQEQGPIPPPYDRAEPDLYELKAHIAAREALCHLHSIGVLVPFGRTPEQIEERTVIFHHRNGSRPGGIVSLPSLYPKYRLASAYQGQQRFRLASGDIYLSSINHNCLPSRAIRCLKECGEAFRHGLYLSAIMTVGAASESLWMELGDLVCQKNVPGTTNLATELAKSFPNIGAVIDPTWSALLTAHKTLVKGIFEHEGACKQFRVHAERLREHRNYAMHNKDANVDEPWFTYDETGLFLLKATTYFNQFADLLTAVRTLP